MEEYQNKIDLRRLWRAVKQCKWIYLAAVVVFTGIGIWFAANSLPKYTVMGELLVGETIGDSDAGAGGISQMMKTFSVGGFGASTVDNEVLVLQSHDVMIRTVRNLGLNRTYIGKTSSGHKAMLYRDSPVRLEAPAEYFDTLSTGFNVNVSLLDGGKADVKVTQGFFNSTLKSYDAVELPATIQTGYGDLRLMAVDSLAESPYRDIRISVTGNEQAALALTNQLTIDVESKLSDVIYVELLCNNARLGIDIVNGIMAEYNIKRLNRVHESSLKSVEYYDDRIADVFANLEKAENAVADYRRDNNLTGIDAEAGMLLSTTYENKLVIETAISEIAYYEMVVRILRDRMDTDAVIPQVEKISNEAIARYNEAILQRRDLKRSATDDNTVLQVLNDKIDVLRDLVIQNSEETIDKAKHDLRTQQTLQNQADSRLDKYPGYELEYRALIREREYQNQLYQYLVSQRENAVLQLYSETDYGYIFQPAYVAETPTIFRKLLWPSAMLLLALFGVSCLAILIYLFSRKVKEPMDVAFMGVEDHTVAYSGSRQQINRMRNIIGLTPDRRRIYLADLTADGAAARALTDSFLALEKSVETIGGLPDNDALMTRTTLGLIEQAQSKADYVVIDVPDIEALADIEPAVDAPESLLMVIVTSGSITRKRLRALLKGQTADKVYLIIASR